MGTIANAKVTHYYNCYNGDFIGCLRINDSRKKRESFVGSFLFIQLIYKHIYYIANVVYTRKL